MDPLPEPSPPPPRPRRSAWPVVLLFSALLGAGAVLLWRVLAAPRGPAAAPAPVADAGSPVDAGPKVSLEEGDALLKTLGAGWSSDPLFLQWLQAGGLQQLAAATQLVADGESPRPVLPFLSVKGPFAVREAGPPSPKPRKGAPRAKPTGRLFIAPATYARYDELTRAFTSVDGAAAGDGYARLRPFLDAAFQEIGPPGQRFDEVLVRALERLLSVRFPEGEVELVPKGLGYGFKDEALESKSAAEKHLLRLGPKNGRAVQATLRDFATHAGLKSGAPP